MICISSAADEISGMWIREDNKNDQATVKTVSVSGDVHFVNVKRRVKMCICNRECMREREGCERGSSISHLRFEYFAIIVLKCPISGSAGHHYASTIWCDIQIHPK